MKEHCKKYPGHLAAVAHFNKYKGPHNNKQLTSVGFVEFVNRDSRDNFLKEASGDDCEAGGAKVKVKEALPHFFRQRDWALNRAADLVKTPAGTRKVSLERNSREVKVGAVVAFKQEKEDAEGTFLGEFSNLTLR